MISFKQYLLNESKLAEDPANTARVKWQSDYLDVEKGIELLNKKSKDGFLAIQNNGLLFRGDNNWPANKIASIDPSTGFRTSVSSSNLYQLMMQESESLKAYPSRSKSLICSTKEQYALNYGYTFVIIPYDGTQITYSKSYEDFVFTPIRVGPFNTSVKDIDLDFSLFFRKFNRGGYRAGGNAYIDADQINERMSKYTPEQLAILYDRSDVRSMIAVDDDDAEFDSIVRRLDDDLSDFTDLSFEETRFISDLVKRDKVKMDDKTRKIMEIFRSADKKKRFTAVSSYLMTEASLKISKAKFGSSLPKNVECWFSGAALAIPCEMFVEMLIQIKKQKIVTLGSQARQLIKEYKYED